MKRLYCSAFLLSVSLAALTGCGTQPTAAGVSEPVAKTMLTGALHGGQQPVAGATVTLFAPNTTGYGLAPTAITSTTTNGGGGFQLPSYNCPANSGMVYLLATGGNSGSGNNPALALAAVLGPCNLLTPSTFIDITEETTIAAAYVLAPFASVSASGTGIGTSPSNLQGLANGFGPAVNLVNNGSGLARSANEIPGMVLPQTEINTLANVLASCVNSSGSTASNAPCGMLFAATTPTAGVAPIDTFQAALNIALNPGSNAATLFNLSTPNAPFQPTLSAAPTDFALGIQYTGGGIGGSYGTQGMAIDGFGNAWIATGDVVYNAGSTHSLTEITPAGVFQSGTTGYGSGAMQAPTGVAIDASNNVYVTDVYANEVFKFTSNGALNNTFSPSSLTAPAGIAIDTDNTFWVVNSAAKTLSHVTAAGTDATRSPYSTQAGGFDIALNAAGNWSAEYSPGNGANGYLANYSKARGLVNSYGVSGYAAGVALDSSGYVWYSADGNSQGAVGRLNATGSSNLTPVPVALPLQPQEVAIDGLNRVWVNAYNRTNQSAAAALLEYSAGGALLSPGAGLTANGVLPALPGGPEGLVVDGSGNLWMTGQVVDGSGAAQAGAYVTELVGIAAPVVTPLVTAAQGGKLGTRP